MGMGGAVWLSLETIAFSLDKLVKNVNPTDKCLRACWITVQQNSCYRNGFLCWSWSRRNGMNICAQAAIFFYALCEHFAVRCLMYSFLGLLGRAEYRQRSGKDLFFPSKVQLPGFGQLNQPCVPWDTVKKVVLFFLSEAAHKKSLVIDRGKRKVGLCLSQVP